MKKSRKGTGIAGHGPLELGGVGVYYTKFVRYYNGIRRLGEVVVQNPDPCVPRYGDGGEGSEGRTVPLRSYLVGGLVVVFSRSFHTDVGTGTTHLR